MANDSTATKITVRVKRHLIKTIIVIEANISIVTYPIVKRLQLVIGSADGSQIIAVDQ